MLNRVVCISSRFSHSEFEYFIDLNEYEKKFEPEPKSSNSIQSLKLLHLVEAGELETVSSERLRWTQEKENWKTMKNRNIYENVEENQDGMEMSLWKSYIHCEPILIHHKNSKYVLKSSKTKNKTKLKISRIGIKFEF